MPDIMQTSIKSLPLVYRGKVRECYAVGEDKLLMIATDRSGKRHLLFLRRR